MSSVVSLPNHIFTGQACSSKRLTSIMLILSYVRSAMHAASQLPVRGPIDVVVGPVPAC